MDLYAFTNVQRHIIPIYGDAFHKDRLFFGNQSFILLADVVNSLFELCDISQQIDPAFFRDPVCRTSVIVGPARFIFYHIIIIVGLHGRKQRIDLICQLWAFFFHLIQLIDITNAFAVLFTSNRQMAGRIAASLFRWIDHETVAGLERRMCRIGQRICYPGIVGPVGESIQAQCSGIHHRPIPFSRK